MEYNTLVTKQDYLYFAGVDLDLELTSRIINDVGDNPAPRFIWGIENWLKIQCKKPPYLWNGIFNTNHQTNQFKEATLYQIQYVLRNGVISNDSGFNTATGTIVPRELLDKIGMHPEARTALRLGGFLNL